mmetsp:Transcript_13934/g.36149  ORF Transcript_13934/g.36149 Transcript_13934/m.36149 type:complete len:252 (+) Transcript_13934:1831-2586(+)
MLGVVPDEDVDVLGCAERVVVELVELGRGGLGARRAAVVGRREPLWRVVPRVEEAGAIGGPADVRELDPLDHVWAEVGARAHVAHADGGPVGAGARDGVRQLAPVAREGARAHRRRAVRAERVRVEQHLRRAERTPGAVLGLQRGALLLVHDGLVLQPRVVREEAVPLAVPRGAPPLLVVVHLAQLGAHVVALRAADHLLHVAGERARLRVDEGLRRRGILVLQPAVRVSHAPAVQCLDDRLIAAHRRIAD